MKHLRFIFGLLAFSTILVGCTEKEASAPRLKLLATTTNIQSVTKAIGGDLVEVRTLIPGGSCPGHYDISPGDVQALHDSRAIIIHGYEQFIPRLLESAGNSEPEVHESPVKDNWLIPENQIKAGREIADYLTHLDPVHKSAYDENLARMSEETRRLDKEFRQRIRAVSSDRITVVCSNHLVPVLQWMGFKVVGEYGRPEEFTPSQLSKLVRLAKERDVKLVADNLQSGPDAGKQIAEEVGAGHVNLSNFPGGYPGMDTWALCMEENVRRVVEALDRGSDGKSGCRD